MQVRPNADVSAARSVTITELRPELPAMKTINRSALVVKPAQPFLDWLHRVDPTSTDVTLDDLILEPTIYLLPERDTEDEALQLLAEVSNESSRSS